MNPLRWISHKLVPRLPAFRTMRCPTCKRVASVPDWCSRPICLHSWAGSNTPEIWDGDDVDGEGRSIEESPNEEYRTPGKHWSEMHKVLVR
jgi:hypothetical protein